MIRAVLLFFGLFGCSSGAGSAIVYRPDANAPVAGCAMVDVTDVHIGKPVSPSMVRPDSWFEGTVQGGEDGPAKMRVDFESLTNVRPVAGERWRVSLHADGHAVQLAKASAEETCD